MGNGTKRYKYYFIGGGLDGTTAFLEDPAPNRLIVDEHNSITAVDDDHSEWPFYSRNYQLHHTDCDGVYVHIKNEEMLQRVNQFWKAG